MLRRISFVVYDTPQPLSRARFARLPGGGVRTYTTGKDQNVRLFIRDAFMRAVPDWDLKPLQGPLRLQMTAWLPMPKSIPRKRQATALPFRRPDLDNYVKQVEDALNHYAFLDDAQIVTIEARKRYVGTLFDDGYTPGLPTARVTAPCWEIVIDEIEA